ncbi:hydrolase [Rhizobium sp. NRK18]|uniref:hydrolase n=1 Tax=Rhizobium sp. NRK18 TaxID=2964667 RepID=UPI0021C33C8A|nr:hydrolase [Rhizobium sp. NRK18]MCQ2004769.1 hydrolase [Rhizobium sp. NRK18]
MISLDPKTTALVLIDLQKGIAQGRTLAPHSGDDVIARGKALAARFREAGSPVVLVNVGWHADLGDGLKQPVDEPMARPPGGLPADWSELVDGLAEPGDLRVTKRQWGAFNGTELDLQLRRRGIRTIVLGGIATNFGVESTARQAYELGYELVILEDACSTMSEDMHAFPFRYVFPRIARIATSSTMELAQA